METRFCHNCGCKVAASAKFCGNCGTALQQPPAPETIAEPVPAPIPAPVTPEPEAPKAAPSVVFTLDTLEAPVPEPPKPAVVFTLDSLPEAEAETESAPLPPAEPETSEPEALPEPEILPEPEVTPEPEGDPAPQPKPRPKKGILARRGVGRTILAVLVCILIFVWSFASMAVLNIRLATTGELGVNTLEQALGSVDLTEIPASLVVMDLQDPDLSVAEWIVVQVTNNYQGRVDADPEDLQEFMEDSSVLPFLAEQLRDYLADIYSGTTDSAVTTAEIEALLTADTAVISDIFGEDLTPEDITAIAQAAVDSGALELFSAESLKENNSQVYRIANLALSWYVIGAMGVILLALILLLGAVNRSVLRTMGDTGITLMVMSAIWGIGGLFVMVLPKVWDSLLYPIRPVGSVLGALLQGSLIPTAAAFGTGVVLVLIKVLGKKIVTKSAKKQAQV